MKRAFFLVFVLHGFTPVYSQSGYANRFGKLSSPEKRWVIAHPFAAKKAIRVTRHCLQLTDSLMRFGTIGNDLNGGRLDAFKHSCWMMLLTEAIGERKSRKLGTAHEKGNYLQFLKAELEEGVTPDSLSGEMDLRNNAIGRALGKQKMVASDFQRVELILTELQAGKLWILKKDSGGNCLTCEGNVVVIDPQKKSWYLPKCLIPSN